MTSLKQKRFVDTDYFHEQLDSTTVEVEGSHISATETKIGYTTDLEILGNTVQNAEDLADIRSVGEQIDGQELYEIDIKTCGKNLFNGQLERGTISKDNGLDVNYDQEIRNKGYIKLPNNKDIICSTSANDKGYIGVRYYDDKFKFISAEGAINGNALNIPSNAKYMRFKYISTDLTLKFQFEVGTVATSYEPYQEDKLTILSPTPLEKVGNVADRIVCKDGVWGVEKNIVTKQVHEFSKIIKGDTNSETQLISYHILDFNAKNTGSISDLITNAQNTITKYADGTECVIRFDTSFDNADKVRDWCKSNGIFVKYVYKTPQFIPLPKDQQIRLRTFLGTTHIFFEGTEIEGTIKCKVPKSVGGTLESLVEKAKITDDRIEVLETVSERNNMKYSTDKGVVHCKDTVKGKVNDLAIEGNTMVNYCTDGSKTLTLNGDINEVGTQITTTNAVDNGLVDVMCEGRTMVNVCDQKDSVAITKSYTVESENHVALQGEYDGKARPVVVGNTLVNLVKDFYSCNFTLDGNNYTVTRDDTDSSYANLPMNLNYELTNGKTYTAIIDIKTNTLNGAFFVGGKDRIGSIVNVPVGTTGIYKYVFTYDSTLVEKPATFYIGFNGKYKGTLSISKEVLVLEGDYTNKPIPSYFEGLKSSFEDNYIPENLVKNVSNGVSNPNLYSVIASCHISKVKPNMVYTLYVKNKSNSTLKMYGNEYLFKNSDRNIHLDPNTSIIWSGTTADTLPNEGNLLKLGYAFNDTVNLDVMFLEGDYTSNLPTYEDVVNHSGKYKVDYKVTGKNKIDISSTSSKTHNGVTFTVEGQQIKVTGTSTSPYATSSSVKLDNCMKYGITYKCSTFGGESSENVELLGALRYYDTSTGTTKWANTITWKPEYKNAEFYVQVNNVGAVCNHTITVQLEEGTTATTYEPYKESIKTYYLNSPLLEGDTIEEVNGKANHVHRWGTATFTGNETGFSVQNTNSIPYVMIPSNRLGISNTLSNDYRDGTSLICDKLQNVSVYSNNNYKGICLIGGSKDLRIRLTDNDTVDSVVNWIKENKPTFIYKLANPTYEVIDNDPILIDSYVNGHLDFDTSVPIKRVVFGQAHFPLKYLYPSTEYIVQFEADNNGCLEFAMAGSTVSKININKGINKFNITSVTGKGELWTTGIGFSASNIVVTEAVNEDFGYFSGMKSVGELEENKIEILSQNKNLFNVNDKFTTNATEGEQYITVNENTTTFTPPGAVKVKTFFKIKVEPNTTYTVSGVISYGMIVIYNHTVNPNLFPWNSSYIHVFRNYTSKENNTLNIQFTTGSDEHEVYMRFSNEGVNATSIFANIQIEEGSTSTSYVPYASNKKEILLNEPLRSLPNGIKDRFVKIGQKWYIERNCGEIVLDGSENWLTTDNWAHENSTPYYIPRNYYPNAFVGKVLNNNFKPLEAGKIGDVDEIGVCGCTTSSFIGFRVNTSYTTDSWKQYLQNNPQTVLYQLTSPTYEPVEVEPTLNTYVDVTHISNNSTIPCDMKVKNSGYSTIIKPSTLYTLALDTNNSGEVKVNLGGAEKTTTNNIVTLTTPSTLVDNELRISGKGLTSTNVRLLEGDNTNFIPSYFEGLKSSFDEKQGDNHIVEIVSNNKNLFDGNWEYGTINSSNGALGDTTTEIRSVNFMKVRQGEALTFSYPSTENLAIRMYDKDKKFIGSTELFPQNAKVYSGDTRTVPNNIHYMKFKIFDTNLDFKLQVQEGSKVTGYTKNEQNKQQFSTLAPLRSVGDISDKLVYKDNKWMIERNCVEFTLNGELTWKEDNVNLANRKCWSAYTSITDDIFNHNSYTSVSNKIICADLVECRYNFATGNTGDEEGFAILSNSNQTPRILISTHQVNLDTIDMNGFKKWLNENPKTFVAQLKTPYYEELPQEFAHLDSYDEGTTLYANTFIAPKSLSFNLATHMNNIVRDVQDDVSDLKTWRSEVFDSITHKKTFDSGFTTIEDTKEGVIDEVKLEGKTLVNLARNTTITYSSDNSTRIYTIPCNINCEKGKTYTLSMKCTSYNLAGVSGIKIGNWGLSNGQVQDKVICKGTGTSVYKFTISENASTRAIQLYIDSGVTSGNATLTDFVILEGDHTQNPPSYFEGLMSAGEDVDEMSLQSVKGDTSHKSDKKPLLYYNEETQTWEKPVLREWDSIEKHSDGKYYYHKRSEKVVFRGNEFWELIPASNSQDIIGFNGGGLTTSSNVLGVVCDKFPTIRAYGENANFENIFLPISTRVQIRINKSKLSTQDVQGFKQWLQNNNVTVVYQLAEEKVYEVANIELNSYDGNTNIIVNSGAISPITTVSLTSNLPQVAENLKNRVRQLEDEVYNYKVVQNIRQLRTFYKSDYANFGIAVVTNSVALTSTEDITPYGYDLFELFKQIIEEGKDTYDRIELEEYIDFYVMTFIFNFDMAFELFDMIDSQHLDSDIEEDEEEEVEDSEIIEDEPIDPDFSVDYEEPIDLEFGVDYEEPTIDEDIDIEMGVIPDDDQIDVDMGVVPDEDIDPEMGVIPNEPSEEEDNSNLEG